MYIDDCDHTLMVTPFALSLLTEELNASLAD